MFLSEKGGDWMRTEFGKSVLTGIRLDKQYRLMKYDGYQKKLQQKLIHK